MLRASLIALLVSSALAPHVAWAADAPPATTDAQADLAKKLQNPIADLILAPFKMDFDGGIGPAGAGRETYIAQPVIPISISDEWNMISRTILPYVDAQPVSAGSSGKAGLADTLQSFFFSPKAPTSGGWIWGAGPALSLPTGSHEFGTGKWSLGPTVVVLKQESGWTYGVLANQLWSVGGSSTRADVSSAFFQPFLSYTTKSYTTLGLNSETTFDWKRSQVTAPINVTVSQLLRLGGQPISLLFGGRVYANRPSGGPDWGLRFQVTLLFPK